ncbi:glycosyl transferase [Pseudoponticoccus marisrubri]|uniref:Glycosyl transferase n=2 Tax=Pseudoponticoccus marisrubri TaxID=1685382 RepID=A0A0W7WNK7_9RHOB|nr:glycosyl transferase [Pseudoponticoccus marisrubri]
MEAGQVAPRSMLGALAEAGRIGRPVEQVLAAERIATRAEVLSAQARHFGAIVLRRAEAPPDPDLVGTLPPEFCLAHGVLPWLRLGETLVLATARPERFEALLPLLPADIGPVMMALTHEADIQDELAERCGAELARAAETWRPEQESCRDFNHAAPAARVMAGLCGALCLALLVVAPVALFGAALALALASLIVAQGLKLAALVATPNRPPDRAAVTLPRSPPRVTILVPLFREAEIATTLVTRLSRVTYPRTLLEVILVLEAEDAVTRAALARTELPPWMRVVVVPPGPVTTKPRALNYALCFALGDIVGIYDAEDSPAPDQIDRVVARFAEAPADLGCLQGILDFYNPRANWLSRCFAIEYASWFRILLPGLVRLGFAIPLGGTTVFFRREALEDCCGWDAHNVTEDADLGLWLARAGWRTEMLPTVTREEANNRAWPWVKQRSRWLKGYVITWWVHSRRPRALLRDLGPRRFAGMQMLFLTTIVQFTLAPVLWSFWLFFAGLPHPLDPYLSQDALVWLTALFLGAEATALLIGLAAVARTPHRGLMPWVPTLFAYYPMATLAIYKALWETVTRPFYWDKTQHGHSAPDGPGADLPTDTG